MCLVTYDCTPTVADEDVVAYKMLIRWNGISYTSPFQAHPYIPDKEITSILEDNTNSSRYAQLRYRIEEGLHSFITLEAAKKAALRFSKNNGYVIRHSTRQPEIVILKAIIPKGAKYYSGEWDIYPNAIPCYASDTLKVTSEVMVVLGNKWYQRLWNTIKCAFI